MTGKTKISDILDHMKLKQSEILFAALFDYQKLLFPKNSSKQLRKRWATHQREKTGVRRFEPWPGTSACQNRAQEKKKKKKKKKPIKKKKKKTPKKKPKKKKKKKKNITNL